MGAATQGLGSTCQRQAGVPPARPRRTAALAVIRPTALRALRAAPPTRNRAAPRCKSRAPDDKRRRRPPLARSPTGGSER